MMYEASHKHQNIGEVTGERFLEQNYLHQTENECDFILSKLVEHRDSTLLDIGCGYGRHAIGLSKQGLQVTGVDISQDLLKIGKKRASGGNIPVEFVQADARYLNLKQKFDYVVSLYTGAFGIMDNYEENKLILHSIYKSLKPGGKFLLMFRNAIYCIPKAIKKGKKVIFNENKVYSKVSIKGESETIQEELVWFSYTISEMKLLLKLYGLTLLDCYDGSIGKFGENPVSDKSKEIIILGKKT